MNLQIETITTKGGAKVDAIRDIESVRKLIDRISELEADNTRLWRENDANAFKIAPATYEAKIDQLEKERDAWKECAESLSISLHRFINECRHLHHDVHERHTFRQSCPVEHLINESLVAFDKLKGERK